jgi:hypothetical protein
MRPPADTKFQPVLGYNQGGYDCDLWTPERRFALGMNCHIGRRDTKCSYRGSPVSGTSSYPLLFPASIILVSIIAWNRAGQDALRYYWYTTCKLGREINGKAEKGSGPSCTRPCGEIRKKRSDTLVRTLREEYGDHFAPGYRPTDKLGRMLKKGSKAFTNS